MAFHNDVAKDHDTATMLAADAYEALPQAERYVGSGRFGWVKKVRRRSDQKVGDRKLY